MIKVPGLKVNRILGKVPKMIVRVQKLLANGREGTARQVLEQYILSPLVKVDESLLSMLHVPLEHYKIMQNEVTVGQFKQFVEHSGYKIEGHNAENLHKILADPSHFHKAIRYINLHDARAYAGWLRHQTGRELHVPTKYELYTAMTEIGVHLSGENLEWTATKKRFSKDFFLYRIYYQSRSKIKSPEDIYPVSVAHLPDYRYLNVSFRLVERTK